MVAMRSLKFIATTAALCLSLNTAWAHKPDKEESEVETPEIEACMPEKAKPAKPQKVRIAHCGCNSDGTDLVWKHIKVSTNAKGHLNHLAWSEERPKDVGCLNADESEENLLQRAAGDCRLSGEEYNIKKGDGLPDCVDPEAEEQQFDPIVGDSCALVAEESTE